MDPVSILGVITAAGSVFHLVVRSINRLSDFRAKYRDAPMVLTSLLGQLCTVRMALGHLRAWSKKHLRAEPRYAELAQQVGDALACFTTLIIHLDNQLDIHDNEELANITVAKRLSFLWKERDLKGYSQMLDCQVNALTLLLEAVQCNNLTEQRRLLASRDSIAILSCALDCSSSVRACKDGRSSHAFSSLFLDDIDIRPISKIFEFDSTLLESKVYSVAYRSHLKKLLTAPAPIPAPDKKNNSVSQQPKHYSLNPSITAILFSNEDISLHLSLPRTSSSTASATNLVRARQASYYSIRNGNRLFKKAPRSNHSPLVQTTEFPISFDGFLPAASRAAAIDPSFRVYAADIRAEPWREWFSSIVHNPSLPLKGCSFAVALGWVAEEFSSYRSKMAPLLLGQDTKPSDVKRYFPTTLTDARPGYLHLDLVAPSPSPSLAAETNSHTQTSVISLSIRLVDITDYDNGSRTKKFVPPVSAHAATTVTTAPPAPTAVVPTSPAGPRDNQFLLVRIPRVVVRLSPNQIVDCYG